MSALPSLRSSPLPLKQIFNLIPHARLVVVIYTKIFNKRLKKYNFLACNTTFEANRRHLDELQIAICRRQNIRFSGGNTPKMRINIRQKISNATILEGYAPH